MTRSFVRGEKLNKTNLSLASAANAFEDADARDWGVASLYLRLTVAIPALRIDMFYRLSFCSKQDI